MPSNRIRQAEEALAMEIASFMATAGGGWFPEQRQEFIDQTLHDLAQFPAILALPAVKAARLKIYQSSRFLSYVVEMMEDAVAKLRVEHEMLETLARIAAGMDEG